MSYGPDGEWEGGEKEVSEEYERRPGQVGGERNEVVVLPNRLMVIRFGVRMRGNITRDLEKIPSAFGVQT